MGVLISSQAAVFPGEEDDLTEMLGNLRRQRAQMGEIPVSGSRSPPRRTFVTLRIEDDGPGLSQDLVPQITRGQRWDETQPGTGFGLAITRDLAEGYRGSLELAQSNLGGLNAIITIPLARHGQSGQF